MATACISSTSSVVELSSDVNNTVEKLEELSEW